MRTLLLVLVGCGSPVPVASPPPPPSAVTATPVHTSYTVLMGELGDPGIDAKLVHHARLARHSRAWLRVDGEPLSLSNGGDGEVPERDVLPVVGETRDRVRVVSSDDQARLAIWIARSDLALTTIAETEVFDAHVPGNGQAGVWLTPGADLDVESTNEPRAIKIRDPKLEVRGAVPAAAIGTVWVGPVPPAIQSYSAGPYLESGAKIFASPDDHSRVLARVTDDMPSVKKLGSKDHWTEIELARGAMRVRGFAPDRDITDENCCLLGHGSGTGHGYGISDTDRFMVAASACLYDRDGGEVIGVNLKERTRYGYLRRDAEWMRVFIGTPHWGTIQVSLHVVGHAGDQPVWESCKAR